jgi:hypothetical protein
MPEPEPEPGVIYDAPDWVRQHRGPIGLHTVGKPGEVYGVASTTVERWIELEPGYGASVELTEKTRDDPIYAVFIRGKWGVVGPPVFISEEQGNPSVEEPEIRYNLKACRAVLDKRGLELNAQCWGEERPARPAFGPFNDQ